MITPLAAVPASFHSIGAPQLDQHAGDILSVTAGPQTDWFVDPGSGEVTGNAPALVAPIPGDFTLSARIEVDFAATYDAGSLVVWAGPTRWGKLAFERSPQGEHMVV